jgi:ABC-type branched-subunit amino acid transport system substrate-binding protein
MRPGRTCARLVSVGLASLLVAACGSSAGGTGANSGGSPGSGALQIAMVNPFTGNDAAFGQSEVAGCVPAVKLVNAAGGVLGHKLSCLTVDTKGDPVDAVPAVTQMIATDSNVVGVLGPSGDEATATVPLLTRAKLVMFAATGQAIYDHNTDPYFWRITPADDTGGTALAVWAYKRGYRRGAALFGDDVGAQASVPALLRAFRHLGGRIVVNESLALNQTEYGSEVAKLLAAHPQVIFTEASPQTDATALRSLRQLQGMLPILGTNATAVPQWLKSVSSAIGTADMERYYVCVEPYAPTSGPAWTAYDKALLASSAQVPNPAQWANQEYSEWPYDAVNIMALAMLAAHSTQPSVYNRYVERVVQGVPGAKVVYTFRQGKAALAAGQKIRYVGASGDITFDRWHNSTGEFEAQTWRPNGTLPVIGIITPAELAQAAG